MPNRNLLLVRSPYLSNNSSSISVLYYPICLVRFSMEGPKKYKISVLPMIGVFMVLIVWTMVMVRKGKSTCFCNVCSLKAKEIYRGMLKYDSTAISKTCLRYTKSHSLISCYSDSSTLDIVILCWHLNL